MPHDFASDRDDPEIAAEGEAGSVCTSVCTILDEGEIEAAIANVTRLLAEVDDAKTGAELVRERAALRAELTAMRDDPPAPVSATRRGGTRDG